jgi:hypothetical protein
VGLSFPDRVSTESYLCACTNVSEIIPYEYMRLKF